MWIRGVMKLRGGLDMLQKAIMDLRVILYIINELVSLVEKISFSIKEVHGLVLGPLISLLHNIIFFPSHKLTLSNGYFFY